MREKQKRKGDAEQSCGEIISPDVGPTFGRTAENDFSRRPSGKDIALAQAFCHLPRTNRRRFLTAIVSTVD